MQKDPITQCGEYTTKEVFFTKKKIDINKSTTIYFQNIYIQPQKETMIVVAMIFPRWVDEDLNVDLYRPMEIKELTQILYNLRKDKSPRLDDF